MYCNICGLQFGFQNNNNNNNIGKTSAGNLILPPSDSTILSKDEDIKHTRTLLLLGGTESGKSTVLKQMRLKYGSSFGSDKSSSEILEFRNIIRNNIWSIVGQLISAFKRLEISEPVNCYMKIL
jgi:ABC-type transporter Mla maintaining outer membrane lipid asymmetry ATPase subunit MlaF